MQSRLISSLLSTAALVSACVLPTGQLSNTITSGFRIRVQNPAYPVIHDHYMNLQIAGGGDKHLFLDPVGDAASDLVLKSGVIYQDIIHAVINGEVS
jgi:hypothetical protein